MRTHVSLLALAILGSAAGYGHEGPLLPDTRPFGKYLVLVCILNAQNTAAECSPPAPVPKLPCPPHGIGEQSSECPLPPELIRQTITFKQVAPPGSPTSTQPSYPLSVGGDFYVSATASSGLPVSITPIAGAVAIVPPAPSAIPWPPGTSEYRVNGPGTVILKAEQNGAAGYDAAQPVSLFFGVGPSSSDATCNGLFPSGSAQAVAQLNASAVVGLIGSPVPFELVAPDTRTILVYTTRNPPKEEEKKILDGLPQQINLLLSRSAQTLGLAATPFNVELKIPHAAALGDPGSRISALNYSALTVQDESRDTVRITATAQPDCTTWTNFLTDVKHLAWEMSPESPVSRLFYTAQIGASAVTAAFGGTAPPASGSSASTATAGTGSSASGGTSGTGTTGSTTPSASGTSAASGSTGSSTSGSGGSASSSTATIAINQPPGSMVEVRSDTTPCVIAGLTLSNSSACATAPASSAGTSASSGSTATASTSGPGTPAPPPVIAPLGSDLALFSSANPGDDEPITEKKRIITQLDLPRPEMIINAWVMQNSTTSAEAIGAFSGAIRDLVGQHNDSLDIMQLQAWRKVRENIAKGNYFDEPFYHYVVDRYVGDAGTEDASGTTGGPPSAQSAAQKFLTTGTGKLALPSGYQRTDFGICPDKQYCLGYATMFQPMKPRITDTLLALIAAKDTLGAAEQAIDAAEGSPAYTYIANRGFCENLSRDQRDHCTKIWNELDLEKTDRSCESDDLRRILGSAFNPPPPNFTTTRVYLECFRRAAEQFLREGEANSPTLSPSGAGLMRSTVARFLFNYKMSQQYPHEFDWYELSQSADALNSALNPLIEAFNRDIATFQRFVRADVLYTVEQLNKTYDSRCCAKRLFGVDKPSFFNEGIITVNTISGQTATVNTTSQSYVNASAAPQLAGLFSSLLGPQSSAAPPPASPPPASPLPPLLSALATGSPLGSIELATAFLNAYQSSFVQIGRSLNITATPRSLATASSAEISVQLNADESAAPSFFSGPVSDPNANLSRVANHDTTTTIRVESVKLFEVSSFAAVLQRSRSRFPLIPPFVEIPYIGTIAGIPLPPGKEYHQSTAILSAVVVPTAADIAYGLEFREDQVVDGDKTCSLFKEAGQTQCKFPLAVSIHDLPAVTPFNRAMVHCLATDMRSAYSSIDGFTPATANACANLTFDNAK